LELGTSAGGQKTRMMGLPSRQRSSTIFSAIWYNAPTWWQTDEQTSGNSKDCTYT